MVRINYENMDEIGKKLGIQRKDLPRRKMNYFLNRILNFIFQFVIIVLIASMGLYIGDVIRQKPNQSSFYPFKLPISSILFVPVIFLIGGLNSENPEDSLQRSELRLNKKRGFVIVYLILSLVTLSIVISRKYFSLTIMYSVYKKKLK